MESAQLLDDLREIPLEDIHGRYDLESVMERMQGIDASLFTIEVAAGAESSLGDLFDWRNVNDDVKEAYPTLRAGLAETCVKKQ
jgi:dihydroneopterin aldolase